MNTNDSAAAISGDPAAAEIRIQTNKTGSTRSNGRARLTRCAGSAGGPAGADQWLSGEIGGQQPQVGPRLRGVCGRRPLLEFVERQPSVGVRVAQDIYDALPLLV